MKICLLSYHCCPFSHIGGNGVGGMNVYLKELTSELVRFPNVTVDIFTRRQNPEVKEINQISSALRVIHLKSGPEHFVNRKRLVQHVPEFIDNLTKFIQTEGVVYDLVSSHYWLSGIAGEILKSRFSLPLVHTYHTVGFLQSNALGNGEPQTRLETEKQLARVADVIISSSREEQTRLSAEFSISDKKVRVIPPGVNKDIFYPMTAPEFLTGFKQPGELLLLYVGRIEPVKGLKNVISAFAALKRSDKALFDILKLAVIGGGKNETDFARNKELFRIQSTIKNLGLSSKVKFLGSRSQPELKDYYSAADTLIVPSFYESFGLVVLEALSCGTPALVARIGKMQDLIRDGENGFSFDPFDPLDLAACIRNFSARKSELCSAELMRQDVINRYSWEKTADLTLSVFTGLVSDGFRSTTIYQPDERPQPV